MSPVVVDASVVVKWLVDEEDSDRARRLLVTEPDIHVPRLMASEVANSLARRARQGNIEPAGATAHVDSIRRLPLRWADDQEIAADAVRLAIELDHPAYDCMYLALAQRLGVQVVTADMRFANLVAPTGHASAVMSLADYGDG